MLPAVPVPVDSDPMALETTTLLIVMGTCASGALAATFTVIDARTPFAIAFSFMPYATQVVLVEWFEQDTDLLAESEDAAAATTTLATSAEG